MYASNLNWTFTYCLLAEMISCFVLYLCITDIPLSSRLTRIQKCTVNSGPFFPFLGVHSRGLVKLKFIFKVKDFMSLKDTFILNFIILKIEIISPCDAEIGNPLPCRTTCKEPHNCLHSFMNFVEVFFYFNLSVPTRSQACSWLF